MGQLSEIEAELRKLGIQVVAVSPDRPAKLTETVSANELDYLLLSDSTMTGARRLGIAVRFNDLKVAAYKLNDQDIEAASGMEHHLIPVPTVFLVDRNRIIRFVHSDPDHRQRIAAAEVLAVARTFSAGSMQEDSHDEDQ